MGKLAITLNGAEPSNVFPPFILGSSAAASGDDVIIFVTPGGAPAFVKGVLEKIQAKGLPDLMELVDGLKMLGGRVMLCELAFESKGIKPEEIRDGIEIVGATTFIAEASDATLSFSF